MSELLKKLETYADSDYLPMHMPGHKRRMGDLGNPFFIDITDVLPCISFFACIMSAPNASHIA